MIKALMSHNPYPATYAGTGAVAGEILAVPPAQLGRSERLTTVQLSFASAPGAFIYSLLGSLDGVNFAPLSGVLLNGSAATPLLVTIQTNVTHIRLDQTSKANDVVATALLMVA